MGLEFVAYIDEAGDEGFGKLRLPQQSGQSKWLLLGAAIVSKKNDGLLPSWRDGIMELFPNKKTRDLHFRNLNHDQRIAACTALSHKPLGVAVVASNKSTIPSSGRVEVFKQKGYLYNYLVRYLLERVTAECRRAATKRSSDAAATVKIVFSKRGNTDYQSMREYMILMRDGLEVIRPVRSIDWGVLNPDDIRVENHSKLAGLQIADVLTSATASALEPSGFGHTEPRYSLILRDRYLRKSGSASNRGLTIIPKPADNPLTPDERSFINSLG